MIIVEGEGPRELEVIIPAGDLELGGSLAIPAAARGAILFAHGSGSGRRSPRNRFVARRLQESRFATLLLDLLTLEEEAIDQLTAQYRFDIERLGARLTSAADWLATQIGSADGSVGCFGASTGAAAALIAAAERPRMVGAVVSRGGRPDLAGAGVLARVRVPTLLMVGGRDQTVIELNRQAMRHLRFETELSIVPGATHLFEEPGTLATVAELAAAWFEKHLAESAVPSLARPYV